MWADHLHNAVEKSEFYMPSLANWKSGARPNRPVRKLKLSCFTAACAVGHAPFVPEFTKAGLRFGYNGILYPAYKLATGYDAIAKFFGITHGEVESIAEPTNYTTGRWRGDEVPKYYVVRRIRKMATEYAKKGK